jgi:hypothetical protein
LASSADVALDSRGVSLFIGSIVFFLTSAIVQMSACRFLVFVADSTARAKSLPLLIDAFEEAKDCHSGASLLNAELDKMEDTL